MNRLRFIPATDETVDPEYQVLSPQGEATNLSIQVCTSYGAGYAVNEYGPEDDFWVRTIGSSRSLAEAKRIAVAYLAKREGH